jgi:hypothetical protein
MMATPPPPIVGGIISTGRPSMVSGAETAD